MDQIHEQYDFGSDSADNAYYGRGSALGSYPCHICYRIHGALRGSKRSHKGKTECVRSCGAARHSGVLCGGFVCRRRIVLVYGSDFCIYGKHVRLCADVSQIPLRADYGKFL